MNLTPSPKKPITPYWYNIETEGQNKIVNMKFIID